MKKFENIVLSDVAPKGTSIWLKHDGSLWAFTNGWKPISQNEDMTLALEQLNNSLGFEPDFSVKFNVEPLKEVDNLKSAIELLASNSILTLPPIHLANSVPYPNYTITLKYQGLNFDYASYRQFIFGRSNGNSKVILQSMTIVNTNENIVFTASSGSGGIMEVPENGVVELLITAQGNSRICKIL